MMHMVPVAPLADIIDWMRFKTDFLVCCVLSNIWLWNKFTNLKTLCFRHEINVEWKVDSNIDYLADV